jgi:ribonuclease Z
MTMEIIMLGTSCMMPTKERNPSTVFLRYSNIGILFDCGEGTQKAMNICKIKRTDVKYILISHFHGDHVGGLIPLLQTIGNEMEGSTIELHGPNGIKRRLASAFEFIDFDVKLDLRIFEHDLENPKKIVETDLFIIKAANLEHKTPCLGYTFIEKDRRRINKAYLSRKNIPDGPHLKDLTEGKSIEYKKTIIDADKATYLVTGKKVAYITDTLLCNNCTKLAQDVDTLICESTFHSKDQDKAIKNMHLTAKDAAFIANNANVKKLILTHFSQRYKSLEELDEDAKVYFDDVSLASDYSKYKV